MIAHYLQHVPFEGLGSIEYWLKDNGFEITLTRLFESEPLPNIAQIDFLIILGGPMSVNDEKNFRWLKKEKEYITDMINSGKPVLGICLGAQLIASAMGKKVYQNGLKEIGWFPVQGIPPRDNSIFAFPSSTTVFHWHGETFDLPENAELLASSRGCRNQAFQIGISVIGLQFHLETTTDSSREITTNCRNELIPSQYVQTEDQIMSAQSDDYLEINRLMDKILSFLHTNNARQYLR